MKWWIQGTVVASEDRKDGRSLSITIAESKDTWLAVAIETPQGARTLDAALGSHSHKTIGTYGSLASATRDAERFAKKWLGGVALDKCPCGEIKIPRGARR